MEVCLNSNRNAVSRNQRVRKNDFHFQSPLAHLYILNVTLNYI